MAIFVEIIEKEGVKKRAKYLLSKAY